ncbi:hypothetical protein C6P96_11205 [Burkholderia multivorans]|nr:hypothetical protein C6P95_15280 [Burkholderia multivorans]PRF14461.1 hypothetical protein C6P96_11205 [Burkholderia multivorans]
MRDARGGKPGAEPAAHAVFAPAHIGAARVERRRPIDRFSHYLGSAFKYWRWMRTLLQSEAHRQLRTRTARRPTHTETPSMTFAGRFPRCFARRVAAAGLVPGAQDAVSPIPLK